MTDSKATICYLNGLSLQTINEVEKILRSLPQKGTRCEVQVSKPVSSSRPGRGTADVIASSSLKIHDEPDGSPKEQKQKQKIECKVLAEHVRARPIEGRLGVILELVVEVSISEKKHKKTLKMEIECPDFVPARVKIGGKWKQII